MEKIATKAHINTPKVNVGADRIMQRELQHTFFCDNMIKVLNERRHPGKRACDRQSSKKSLAVADKDSHAADATGALTGANLLNLNVNESLTPTENEQMRRQDLIEKGQYKP